MTTGLLIFGFYADTLDLKNVSQKKLFF